jgi:acyl-CoA synthetase (NDP forming)
VRDLDELANALILFAQPHPPAAGGVVSLHDSGGERQLMVDLAEEAGIHLTTLAAETVGKLEAMLDPGLPAVNPLDAWSRGGAEAEDRMAEALSILLSDPGAAIGLLVHDRAPYGRIYRSYVDYMRRAHDATGKPVVLVASRQGTGSDPAVVATTRDLGFPVLDGIPAVLAGVRCVLEWRDARQRSAPSPPPLPDGAVSRWQDRLGRGTPPDSHASLAMLKDFGIAVTRSEVVHSEAEAVAAWTHIGGPVAVKTVAPGIAHRTDVGGVHLAINERAAVAAAWRDLAGRFGPDVEVSEMQPPGIEMLVGMTTDEDIGPVVAIGFGGVHVELQADIAFALPPFDAAHAQRLIERLRLRRLLDGDRGSEAVDVDALCDAAARFSTMAAALADRIREIDVNPLIVHPGGCVAVDVLTILHTSEEIPERQPL